MAKILVADDNSNVQKTVTLALADLGVEVVSVNNGEAAVRKLTEFSPDLVLADIFMPVRNGYEVCEYVKKDPRFAHVPVVLLVGAFDPLDEREAQRVGADGILKKPFVPPDPLITMVKALLDRSMGERLVAVAAAKPPVAVQVKVGNAAVKEVHAAPPPLAEERSPEEFPAQHSPVSFGEGDRPVAFGQLLEKPARATAADTDVIEPVDDEQILTSSRDATLGEPVFWRNDSPEIEPEAERPADNQADLSLRKWGEEEDSLPRREDAALLRPVEPLELIREETEDGSPSDIDSQPIELDPAAQSPLTVESGKAPELAANPIEWLATAPAQYPETAPEISQGWDEQPSGDSQTLNEPTSLKAEPTPSFSEIKAEPESATNSLQVEDAIKPSAHIEVAAEPDSQTAGEATLKVSQPAAQAPEDTARSVPIHKWAEMTDSLEDRASEIFAPLHLASESVPLAQVPTPTRALIEPSEAKLLEPAKPAAVFSLGNSLTQTASVELPAQANLTPSPRLTTHPELTASPDLGPAFSSVAPGPTVPQGPDPALVEAVVLRVLDKMRPQVVDIITKEFLRPVVQALVLREIEKQ